jgi:hypothetical protein
LNHLRALRSQLERIRRALDPPVSLEPRVTVQLPDNGRGSVPGRYVYLNHDLVILPGGATPAEDEGSPQLPDGNR